MRERDGERERGAHIEPLGTLMYAIAPFSTRNDSSLPVHTGDESVRVTKN
jgi:hypothetical protein